MGLFEQFPYTNFHDLNLDWILDFIKSAGGTVENYEERMQAVENAVQELYDADKQFSMVIGRLNSSITDINRSYQQLSTSVSALEQTVSGLQMANEKFETEIANIKKQYQEILEQVQAVRSVPAGGEAGQVLTADGAGGYAWEDAPKGGGASTYGTTVFVAESAGLSIGGIGEITQEV